MLVQYKPFRINTCKSDSKQTTLSTFRINTYEKHRGWGVSHFFGGGTFKASGASTCFPSIPFCFQALTHSFSQRSTTNRFLFNHFRTLSHAPDGVPPLAGRIFPGKREKGCQTETRKGEKGTGARGA